MAGTEREDEFDAKAARIENPSAWMRLTRYETVRLLIDALLEAPPGHQFNKSELERRTGLSREAIREHLPLLVELGVVNELDEGQWPEYRLNTEGKVTRELFALNSALNSVLAGESQNVQDEVHIDLEPENEESNDNKSVAEPPKSIKAIDNAEGDDNQDDDVINRPPRFNPVSNAV